MTALCLFHSVQTVVMALADPEVSSSYQLMLEALFFNWWMCQPMDHKPDMSDEVWVTVTLYLMYHCKPVDGKIKRTFLLHMCSEA